MTQRFDMPAQKEVSQEEIARLFAVDAVYCNKFYVTTQQDGMVRLVFGDTSDPNDKVVYPRYAVIMPMASFVMFSNLVHTNAANIAKNMQAPNRMPMEINPPANSGQVGEPQ